jgi:hypothetical protein
VGGIGCPKFAAVQKILFYKAFNVYSGHLEEEKPFHFISPLRPTSISKQAIKVIAEE